MIIRELIEELLGCNMNAKVKILVNNREYSFSICFGGNEGCKKQNCDIVDFCVDELNINENITNEV